MVNGRTDIESFLRVFCKYTSFVLDMPFKVSIMTNTPSSATAIVRIKTDHLMETNESYIRRFRYFRRFR